MIFTKFDSTDIVSGRTSQVSSGYFNNGNLTFNQSNLFYNDIDYSLNPAISNPLNVVQTEYFLNVYSNETSDLLFSVAYGDYDCTGSSIFDYKNILTDPVSPAIPDSKKVPVLNNETKVIYSQYKNALLQPGDELFSFRGENGYEDGKSIFVINFAADKMKDQIDPGQLQLNFGKYNNGVYSVLKLIDDSAFTEGNQNVYNLIEGDIDEGVPHVGSDGVKYEGLGLFYPKNGIVIINAEALNKKINLISSNTDWRATYNNYSNYSDNTNTYTDYFRIWTKNFVDSMIMVNSLSDNAFKNVNMYVRKSEFVPSTTYFIRVKNQQYNYSNNPTFVSDGTDGQLRGTIKYPELIENPCTYVTTVGLYNENNELMAVGKLSAPWKKSFDDEMLIKCKIDF